MTPKAYAILAGGAFLVALGLLLLFIFQADRIVASGLGHRLFYVLLVPLGLAAGAFAFGAMKSTAQVGREGRPLKVRLTGPAAFAALVVVGGFVLVPDAGVATLVVRVESAADGSPIDEASLIVEAGPLQSIGRTDATGQAVFTGLGLEVVSAGVTVRAEAEGFLPARVSVDSYPADGVVRILLEEAPVLLSGTVLRRGDRSPVRGVVLSFASGAAIDTTDALGNFQVELARTPSGLVVVVGTLGDMVGVNTEVIIGSGAPVTLLFGT